MSIQHTILFAATYTTMFAMFVAFLALGVERSLARSQILMILSGLAFVCMVISLFTP